MKKSIKLRKFVRFPEDVIAKILSLYACGMDIQEEGWDKEVLDACGFDIYIEQIRKKNSSKKDTEWGYWDWYWFIMDDLNELVSGKYAEANRKRKKEV